MTTKQLFTKKGMKNPPEGPQEAEQHEIQEESTTPDQAIEVTADKKEGLTDLAQEIQDSDMDEEEGGTVRLSCDLSRQHHKALRVASAHCELRIIELVEAMIEKHLLDRDLKFIAADYHKVYRVKYTKLR